MSTPDPPEETPAASTTARWLCAESASEWQRGREHPLVVETADDTIPDEVFERWVVVNGHFLRTYRRFLMVMGTLAPDARASRLMFQGVQETDEELQRCEEFAQRRGLDLRSPPSPQSMDYSSYCMASVGQGWARGLVVAYGVERLYFDSWSWARERIVPTARFWEFVDLWSSEEQAAFVAGLGQLVDLLPPTAELERSFRTTVRLELASWDEACGLQRSDAD